MADSAWGAGAEVRLISDPGMIGVCTGITRSRPDGSVNVQVIFPGLGKTFQPDFELELVVAVDNDAFSLLEQGRYGRAEHLRRCLTHIQLSGRLANLVYSMETTNTDFYAYQFKPVLAFLESPSNGLLIADEVGLGKTIEAGLIWTEIRARLDARRLIVLCPAMLREKWQSELSNRFGVEAQLFDAEELLAALKTPKDDFPDGKAVICSLQGVRPPRGWSDDDHALATDSSRRNLARYLRDHAEDEPLIDLLIIDEAHYLRNPDSRTNEIAHLVRAVSEHVLLLSATPINLSDMDLFELLNVIDPDTFRYPEVFPDLVKQNAPLVRAREMALSTKTTESEIKGELRKATVPAKHGFHSRGLELLLSEPMTTDFLAVHANRVSLANQIERLNLFSHVVSRTRKSDVSEFRTVRRPVTEAVPLTDVEQTFYQASTEAIRNYAWRRDISDGFLLAPPQRQVSSCMVAAARAWRAREIWSAEMAYEDFGDEGPARDDAPLIDTLIRDVLPTIRIEELEMADSKYYRLLAILRRVFETNPKEKVVLFSYFRGTLAYLAERLKQEGLRCVVLVGGMGETKQAIIDRFREDIEVQVLLSSEVAAEGVDLQFCRMLVNYDLPWNPMKVEQRIGRIDRLGQQAEHILIWNICAKGTIDERILDRLYTRLKVFERALGGFEAILGEQIQELTGDLLSQRLTPEEEAARIEKTAVAIANIRHGQEQLEAQASNLIAHGGYVLDVVKAAHDFSRRISERDLEIYVREYLQRHAPGHEFRQLTNDGEFEIRLPAVLAAKFGDFVRGKHLSSQTRLASGETVRCRFLNKVKTGRSPAEQISQFHPLIRFIGNEVERLSEGLVPLVAIKLDRASVPFDVSAGVHVFALKRWTFSGLRTEEVLRARAVLLGQQVLDAEISFNLVNHARGYGGDWLDAPSGIAVQQVKSSLELAIAAVEEDYWTESRRREFENADRIALQRQSLEEHKERRMRTLQQTLATHEARGKRSLIAATQGQIRKLADRLDVRLEQLHQKSKLTRSQFDVTAGLIQVI